MPVCHEHSLNLTNHIDLRSSRKIKCVAQRVGASCARCAERALNCSYVSTPGTSHTNRVSIIASPQNYDTPGLQDSITYGGSGQFPAYVYHHSGGQNGHDIGSGSPAEILREGELTYELLLLYFENFSDIHFMFDKDVFLRKFVLGEIPKVILYSLMALGVKYVRSHDFLKKPVHS
jgi:hypothetical protein